MNSLAAALKEAIDAGHETGFTNADEHNLEEWLQEELVNEERADGKYYLLMFERFPATIVCYNKNGFEAGEDFDIHLE